MKKSQAGLDWIHLNWQDKTYVINNISFSFILLGSFRMLRTDEIDLIILEFVITTIYVKYVICIVDSKSVVCMFKNMTGKENNDMMSKSIRRTF